MMIASTITATLPPEPPPGYVLREFSVCECKSYPSSDTFPLEGRLPSEALADALEFLGQYGVKRCEMKAHCEQEPPTDLGAHELTCTWLAEGGRWTAWRAA